tara:strand:+ start:327 stop:482 length:156 start_codon:yes stop_codon:yes gene_type:complete
MLITVKSSEGDSNPLATYERSPAEEYTRRFSPGPTMMAEFFSVSLAATELS